MYIYSCIRIYTYIYVYIYIYPDLDGNGSISYPEFMEALRNEISLKSDGAIAAPAVHATDSPSQSGSSILLDFYARLEQVKKHTYVYTCTFVDMYMCVRVYTYIYTCIYMHVCVYVHICMYTYAYIYVYV